MPANTYTALLVVCAAVGLFSGAHLIWVYLINGYRKSAAEYDRLHSKRGSVIRSDEFDHHLREMLIACCISVIVFLVLLFY